MIILVSLCLVFIHFHILFCFFSCLIVKYCCVHCQVVYFNQQMKGYFLAFSLYLFLYPAAICPFRFLPSYCLLFLLKPTNWEEVYSQCLSSTTTLWSNHWLLALYIYSRALMNSFSGQVMLRNTRKRITHSTHFNLFEQRMNWQQALPLKVHPSDVQQRKTVRREMLQPLLVSNL